MLQETGYKSRMSYANAEYFNLPEKDTRTAKAKRKQPVPTLEQIKHVLAVMPDSSPIEKRNKAIIAFTLLTGARDSAVASFKIKHTDFGNDSIYEDAREVNTKYSKTFTNFFFPVGDDVRNIVFDWAEHLKNDYLFGNNDPLFPTTAMGLDDNNNFAATGLSKNHWSNASVIRKLFKDAFTLAGLPSYNPHSFHNMLVSLGEKTCQSPEEFKAWSQNLGHE